MRGSSPRMTAESAAAPAAHIPSASFLNHPDLLQRLLLEAEVAPLLQRNGLRAVLRRELGHVLLALAGHTAVDAPAAHREQCVVGRARKLHVGLAGVLFV